ncbi:MAG TPA: outer membrane beta-barrel protein [Xanthobacteraceae bacterium]|jgi:outer membrane immunogenic protein|nr:outer membrane beta-barrel protein [Xanthobacteraceae bacterium]
MAADLAVKAPPVAPPSAVAAIHNWSGFYLGVNAGGASAYSGDPTTSASCTGLPGTFGAYFACGDIAAVNALGTGSMSGVGFTGGTQAGYNAQFNSIVVGIEADFGAFNAKTSRVATGTLAVAGSQASITESIDAHWLFTARGRLGWVFNDNLLTYVTGGLAVTRLNSSDSYVDNAGGFGPGIGSWSASATKEGWTAGAGVEWAFTQHWSARAEYLYVRFNTITASGVVANTSLIPGGYANAISTATDLSAHIARAGINYKF